MSISLLLMTALSISGQTATPASIVLKNETSIGIVVQVISTFNGRLFRDRPYLLSPGESTPQVVMPGNKTVAIGDAKNPAKPKVQLGIPNHKEDATFAIIGTDKPIRLEPRTAGKPSN